MNRFDDHAFASSAVVATGPGATGTLADDGATTGGRSTTGAAAAAGAAGACSGLLECFQTYSARETSTTTIAAMDSDFCAAAFSGALAEFRSWGAGGRGGSGAGLKRAGLPVTPGMFGSVGLNGSCSLGLSDTVNRSVVILSLIWLAGICKQTDALSVNGYAASYSGERRHDFARAQRPRPASAIRRDVRRARNGARRIRADSRG